MKRKCNPNCELKIVSFIKQMTNALKVYTVFNRNAYLRDEKAILRKKLNKQHIFSVHVFIFDSKKKV